MARLDTRVIGDAHRNGIAWETLVSLVDIENRMAAHDGEHEGAQAIADTFEEVGLREVTIEEFEVPGWWRSSSTLDLAGRGSYRHQHQVLALPGTPAGEETAELVDVGHGTPAEFDEADIEGKLAMASSKTPEDHDRWIHRKEKYEAAIEGGAVGFVFRNHVEGCLPPTGGIHQGDDPGAIPAVGVSRELGHRLVRHCEDAVEATLSVDCHNETATSQNVSGVIGPDTDERILVTAHHDAHDIAEGAEDNGAGSALVCEVARLFSQLADELAVGVEFTTFGAEETGLRGSGHMAETRDLDEIRAVVNLDAIGGSRSLGVGTHGFDELTATFEAVADALDTPVEVDEDIKPHSDHWPFVQEGVPGIMAYSVSESDGRGWGHTHADTLDKLDKRDFRDLAVVLSAGVLKLATEEFVPERVDPDTIEDRATEQGLDIS
ncbi:Zn-dependent amino-or carboxypeptidase, M28 family [Halovenus aranensis]|uniref:Carboxypeptidase Q n=1 Tax=Halovenus aranensis TaxID=890420 RepID=A0A1G8V8E4_9EURY|nr:M28 family metallopeptidase [Halovenus aranensis]SDJ62362.1 Zn-dependent amino-or carboxypeptidase, M28 family [Halovenus aranensis]